MQDEMMNKPDDHEAKMARADLFKMAQYSFKLFKMISEDQELEGWVQAKITKAADYVASVYHYLEYEMKISEYGDHLENSEMYSESIRRVFAQKLEEAVKQAERLRADMIAEERSSTGGEITRGKGFTRHTHNPARFSDEPHAEPASKAKSRSAAEKASDKAADKAQEKDYKAAKKANPTGVRRYSLGKQVDEASKPDFLDMDKDGDKKEPMKKAVADKKKGAVKEATKAKKDYDGDGKVESGKDEYLGSKIAAARKAGKLKEGTCSVCKKDPCKCNVKESMKKCSECGMYESKCKCSTMESTGDYSAKKAAAGKDIGKPGKNFSKIASKSGGGEKGKKIAGAVLAKLRAKG